MTEALQQGATQATYQPVQSEVLIVGGGPVGIRAANELARQGKTVTVISAEPYAPYNRVRLTPLLAGDVQFSDISVPLAGDTDGRIDLHEGLWVSRIERDAKRVITSDGRVWPYEKLVLATGSRAFIPGIPGADLSGVYTFRTAQDASALLARSFSARQVVVIGGGLLGLEAAKGMRKPGVAVTVIEHESRLMPRQLDETAGAVLAHAIEEIGVTVRTGEAVRQIMGGHKVTGLRLASGEEIPCDTVIVCTGVRANTKLAVDAGLPIGRGIVVNDQMVTGDPDIFAVGECAEHKGRIYGLVGPGFEQADTCVAQIMGQGGVYPGSIPTTKLKVIGADVFSAGDIDQLEVSSDVRSHVWTSEDGREVRRVFIQAGRLAGALAVGQWPQVSDVQNAVQRGAIVYPWMLYRFRRTGLLWPETEEDIQSMPDSATLCNCTGVTCGRLRQAVAQGAKTAPALTLATGAGGVCGTCKPLLEELVDAGAPPKPERFFRALIGISAVAGIGALALAFLPRIPLPTSFNSDSLREWLWGDNIVRQWTGFILLGITVAAMLVGLRKRWRWTDRLGSYDIWRLIHLGIGALAASGLIVHTGLRAGANLNMWLFLSFVGTLVFGAIAGLATGGDHALRARRIGTPRKPARRLPVWGHILLIWPLPVLILIHVLTVYTF